MLLFLLLLLLTVVVVVVVVVLVVIVVVVVVCLFFAFASFVVGLLVVSIVIGCIDAKGSGRAGSRVRLHCCKRTLNSCHCCDCYCNYCCYDKNESLSMRQ